MSSSSLKSRPLSHINRISRFFHSWIFPLLKKSLQQGTLTYQDVCDIRSQFQATEETDTLENHWFDELKHHPSEPSLIRATLRTLGWKPLLLGFLALLHGVGQMMQPLLLIFFMKFFEPCSSMSLWQAWSCAIAIILTALVACLMTHTYLYQISLVAVRTRMAYSGLIYRKVLRLSSNSMNSISSGEITNLLSNDAMKTEMLFHCVNYLWVAPLLLIMVIFIFWYFVKYITFIAIGYSSFILLIQPLFSRLFIRIRTKIVQITDERIKVMSEIIKAMRIVKMYCWESAFIKKINEIRKREFCQYALYNLCDCLKMLFAHNYITITFLFMYGAMWLFNIHLNIEFFAIASCILNFMRVYVIDFFSYAVRDLSDYLVARKRIETFLLLDECKRDNRLLSSSYVDISAVENNSLQVICDLKQAHWNKNEKFMLKNINFNARPGDLICIIGPVGSGKSSLLQTLTGEIGHFEGKVRLNGSFCYVPQEAWIFSSTIKNNILFGQEYNHRLFQHVIRTTALETDLEQLSDGVNTLVGDQGVMLSGGQKARVNMARALYRNADIYLLDDPLSAVDVKVSKHLFEKCIKEYLSEKICILVTHQIQFLQYATNILVLDNGELVQMGTYEKLISSSSSFAHLLGDIHQHEQELSLNYQNQQSIVSSIYSEKDHKENSIDNFDTKQEGTVKWNVYLSYIRAGLGCLVGFVLILLIYTIHQMITMYSSWWLAKWSDEESYRYGMYKMCTNDSRQLIENIRSMNDFQWNKHRNERFYFFAGLIGVLLGISFIRNFLSILLCLNASRVLHNKMFQRIVHCPISFFDKTPIGRILNRFTRDIAIMDDDHSMNIPDFIQLAFHVLGAVILVGILNIWSFIPALLGVIGMIIVRYYFAPCFRDLKRLEGITRSPIYSYLSSTIHGLKVIRSYHAEQMCSNEFLSHLDNYFRVYVLVLVTERWAAMRFDGVSMTFLSLVTCCSILVRIYSQQMSTADIALILSYTLSLMGHLQWTIRQSVTIESDMTAVERVLEYCKLDQEPSLRANHPPLNWPNRGQIIFRDVSMSYSNEEDSTLALRNLSLTIEGGEKIGIVGRTGAGKSSLIQILFRMGRLVHGQIEIDHINIETIGLDDLRSRISIIPQDPVLFTGTIRTNLDPFHFYSDEQLWNALDEVQLKSFVRNRLSNGLEASISENGLNLSVGQKQLICLARAILKKSQILVIDEATANVDHATDELIQRAIRNKFQTCTVLTVAHRLRTIIDSDRILVLGNGEILEYDTPMNLLANENSSFTALVKQTGSAEANYLRTLAYQIKSRTDNEEILSSENDPLLKQE